MAVRRAAVREESWNSIHHSEVSNDVLDDELIAEEMSNVDGPQLKTVGDVHRALHPLQTTADRVGKQVEKFAETLDKLGMKRDRRAVDCRDVLPLVYEYEKIASETVTRLKRHHEPERQERLRRAWKKQLLDKDRKSTPVEDNDADEMRNHTSTTVEDLENWEQERQTWQLLRLMLQVEYPLKDRVPGVPELEEQFRRPTHTPKIHQFSSEKDVWNSYLETEPEMWEKHVVTEWLRSSADSDGQDIDSVVEQLEMGAERGSGLLAHSWLYSKEEIKKAKRLRSWPQSLEPDSPGIDAALTTPEGKSLVTQLDPDAFSRQARQLKTEDVFFEKAMWLACYEMVRRGHSWKSIREWCQDRVEAWRALSLRGDPRQPDRPQNTADALSGWQARSIWRKMCVTAARDGGIDDYERAVYGILSGDQTSVEKVARGWNDHLFAVYNARLLQGFDYFTRKRFASNLPWEVLDKFGGPSFSGGVKQPNLTGAEVWKELIDNGSTREEALSPYKMLQGSIVAKMVQRYLENQGAKLGYLREKNTGRANLSSEPQADGPTADIGPEDYDLLRILTHVSLVYQVLDPLPKETAAIEHIVMGYVDYLGKAGKQQLLPLYASRLSVEGTVTCMAQQLPTIVDSAERRTVMNLMNSYDLDVPRILFTQLSVVITASPVSHSPENGFPPRRILSHPPERMELPRIERGFMGEDILGDELDLINGMEWYLQLDGHWDETMLAGAYVYRYFFLTGGLAAARRLAWRVSFSTLSMSKAPELVSTAADLGVLSDEDTNEGLHPREAERLRHYGQAEPNLKKEYLLSSSQTLRDLEMLVAALDVIENWAKTADLLSSQVDPRHAKELKLQLQARLDNVIAAVEPVIAKDWLRTPIDEAENADLYVIRRQYLPEIVLAYNTVLAISGQFLSREVLLRCMDLASHVAADNAELASIIAEAGRMGELVDAFSMSSRTILRADEIGIKNGKKGRRGQANDGLGIWTVRREEILKEIEKERAL